MKLLGGLLEINKEAIKIAGISIKLHLVMGLFAKFSGSVKAAKTNDAYTVSCEDLPFVDENDEAMNAAFLMCNKDKLDIGSCITHANFDFNADGIKDSFQACQVDYFMYDAWSCLEFGQPENPSLIFNHNYILATRKHIDKLRSECETGESEGRAQLFTRSPFPRSSDPKKNDISALRSIDLDGISSIDTLNGLNSDGIGNIDGPIFKDRVTFLFNPEFRAFQEDEDQENEDLDACASEINELLGTKITVSITVSSEQQTRILGSSRNNLH